MLFAELLSGRRVLLVEDEPLIALDIRETLETHGMSVIGPAARLSDALDLAKKNPPDVAVLDVRLQADATTFPLADWLLEHSIPFFFQTSDPSLIGSRFRDVPVLRKPFQPDKLLAKIVDLLANQ